MTITVVSTKQRSASAATNVERPDLSIRPVLAELGYDFVSPAELETERYDLTEAVLFHRLEAAIGRLNPDVSRATAAHAAALFASSAERGVVGANERNHRLLHGIEVDDDDGKDHGGSQRLRFIDFERPDVNEFAFAERYETTKGRSTFTAGTVLFVNGIPLVVIEDETSSGGGNLEEVIRRLDARSVSPHTGLGRLLQTVQLLIASHGPQTKYGPVGAGSHRWNDAGDVPACPSESLLRRLGREPSPRERCLHGLLGKRMLLDLLTTFVVSDAAEPTDRRRVARVSQIVAVNQVLERMRAARQPAARGGLVCHAHGSGRSLCMLMLVSKLVPCGNGARKKIVVVSDRLDTEARLEVVLERRVAVTSARNSAALRRMLAEPAGEHVVLASVRQFRGATKTLPVITQSQNIFVVFDDPPRLGYGPDLFLNARRSLPNACFITFIGSPLDEKDRLLFQCAGPYIHRYSATDALRQGATIPVVYESRTVPASADRLVWIAADLVRHFRKHVRARGFKAQLLTRSRDDAIAYKQALDRMDGPESAVLMSVLPGTHPDVSLSRALERERRVVIDRFTDADDPLSILIVCSGSGESPAIHQVTYLDAGPRGHTLLRVLAQPNRALPGKTHASIIDYAKELSRAPQVLARLEPLELENFLISEADVRNLNGQVALAGGSKTDSPN